MALTTLDPRTALIVVDLQKGIVGLPLAHPIKPIIGYVRILADAFRARALPVVLVNVAGSAPGRTEQRRRPARARKDGRTSCRNSVNCLTILSLQNGHGVPLPAPTWKRS